VKSVGVGRDFEVPATFDLSELAQRRPWEFPKEPAMDVVIHVAPRLTPAIREIFGGRVEVEPLPDGTRVRLRVTHRAALIAAVLPYGAAALVVAPESLRAEIAAIHRQLAARYRSSRER